jgi:hypothetical protein
VAEELEAMADRLRAMTSNPDEAAELVERCADLATRLAAEVDAHARRADEAEGQERLL